MQHDSTAIGEWDTLVTLLSPPSLVLPMHLDQSQRPVEESCTSFGGLFSASCLKRESNQAGDFVLKLSQNSTVADVEGVAQP